jgi:hypothetical protein
MLFIGDIHGKIREYEQLIERRGIDCSLQLGDLGAGFQNVVLPNLSLAHKALRGNHDDPAVIRKYPNYLGDYGYLPEQDMYYISGAWSIDKNWRTPGISWWPDEELDFITLRLIIEEIEYYKPRIIASHDCPSSIRKELFGFGHFIETRTGMALAEAFMLHKPTWWIFGHYHRSRNMNILSTNFVCLQELETFELRDCCNW